MTDSGSNEDRPFRAEEILAEVKARRAAGGQAKERPIRDLLVELFGELPEPVLPLRGEVDTEAVTVPASANDGPDDQSAVAECLPTSPAIAVPNHELIRCLGAGGCGQPGGVDG